MASGKFRRIQQEIPPYGYESVIHELTTLLTTYPPPFIYINDPTTPRISASIIRSRLCKLHEGDSTDLYCVTVDAVACFTPRLFYDTVINSLASWTPQWADGCSNWAGPSNMQGFRDTGGLDGFLNALRYFWTTVTKYDRHSKGKKEASGANQTETRFIIFIEHAERLKETMPDIIVPLTRLEELVRFDMSVVMHSSIPWELIRPPVGASPDPYYINVTPLPREAILAHLNALYPSSPSYSQSTAFDPNTYHPNLKPLYPLFLEALYGVCSVYTRDPDELAYIAAARWPGFVQPVLDEHKQHVESSHRQRQTAPEDAADSEDDAAVFNNDPDREEAELRPPDEHTRIRLVKLFRDSFGRALEHLYPRRTSALAWAHANAPPANLLSVPPREVSSVAARLPAEAEAPLRGLPRMAKFVLVAAFLASTNPARTDMRMFGRGPDERKKRRRRAASPRKTTAKNAAVKVPQRLLGPMPFPLDRMFAILGVLVEENDADTRPPAPQYEIPGEYTEMEISRVAVYAQVVELTSMHLLHRTSPADRLNMSPTYKCGIGYDATMSLSRDLGITLNDLMWEPV